MTTKYLSTTGVAEWFDVAPRTVVWWRTRFPYTPEPDAYIGDLPGWLPSSEGVWRQWHRTHGPRRYRRPTD